MDGIEPPTRGFSILLYRLSYLGKWCRLPGIELVTY